MIQYQQKQDKNRKMSQACGKWYAALVERRIVDKEGLAEHMAASRTRTIKIAWFRRTHVICCLVRLNRGKPAVS